MYFMLAVGFDSPLNMMGDVVGVFKVEWSTISTTVPDVVLQRFQHFGPSEFFFTTWL